MHTIGKKKKKMQLVYKPTRLAGRKLSRVGDHTLGIDAHRGGKQRCG